MVQDRDIVAMEDL